MLSNLLGAIKRPPLAYNAIKTLKATISNTPAMLKATEDPIMPNVTSPIVDIDVEKMMYEDEELDALFRLPADDDDDDDEEDGPGAVSNTATKSFDRDGIPLAPVDIDAWNEEDEVKQGTVEVERFEDKPIEYPPIPTDRSGTYQFKGIKVVLPKRMLNPSTYRYRLDPEDQAQLADDIRICKFEK